MEAILVTGAGGLLGRGLCRFLSQHGSRVYGLVHKPTKDPVDGVDYIQVDLSGNWAEKSLPTAISHVVHLAQSSRFRDFPDHALDVFEVNVRSTAKLLDFCRKNNVSQFLYASSGGVYGNGPVEFDENSPIVRPCQLGYYLGSKACSEILVQSYSNVFKTIIIRPFFMYGPNQNRGMLIPRLMDSVSSGNYVGLQGDSGIRINPVHVEDAVEAVYAAMRLNSNAIYNIAGPDILSIRDICTAMGAYLGVDPLFGHLPGDPKDLIADITDMKRKLSNPTRRLVNSLDDIYNGEYGK